MGYINPDILARLILPDYLGAFGRGQQMGGQAQDRRFQQDQRTRQQGFQGAMDRQAGQFDITTPEGQALLARALAGQWYGPEAYEMAGKIPQSPKAPQEDWVHDGMGNLINKRTGQVRKYTEPPPKEFAPRNPYEGQQFEEDKRHNRAMEDIGRISATRPRAGEVDSTGTAVEGLEALPGVKITKDSVKKVKDATETFRNLKKQIQDYRDLYAQTGTEAVGSNATTLQSMATGIKLTLKELQNLGVLNGPDLGLMNQQVPDAGGFLAKGRSLGNFALGDPVHAKLGQLEKLLDTKYQSTLSSNGFRKAGQAPAAPPSKGLSKSEAQELMELERLEKQGR